ncbi:MAG: TRAP transporter substrate-binding protein DctP [Pirellulaceae bacterium]
MTSENQIIKSVFCGIALFLVPLATQSSCTRQRTNAIGSGVWRFAIEESVGSVQHEYATQFEQLIENATDGEIDVVVYPYGALGTSTQITEQLNLGIVQFAMASPGSLGKFIPEMQAFLLHFVLPTTEEEIRELFNNSEMLEEIDTLYEAKGLKLLSMYSEGPMAWTLKQEVRVPADFRGIKMRVMTSPLLIAAYSAYSASPTPMPYSEVYSGLQLNMIDAQVNPLFAIERQKFHEVTSWLVLPGHTSFVTSCAANRDFFLSLPDKHQQIVVQAIEQLDQKIFTLQQNLHWDSLKTIISDKQIKKSVLHLSGDLSGFRNHLSPDEARKLLDDNKYLVLHPALSNDEIQQFRDASIRARNVFIEIGGHRGNALLESLESAVLNEEH